MPRDRGTGMRPMHPEARSILEGLLPSGRMITSDEGDGDVQPLWLSDGPITADLRTDGTWP